MSFEASRSAFLEKLFSWWEINKRELPWRSTKNPYYILLSEFMLIQTQVKRVIPKYSLFLERFPEINDLATATNKELITLWEGLGYNRRVIWLRDICQGIINLGYFPNQPKELKVFKGIGDYISRSIPIFAFNSDYATVDTNIRRILIYEGFVNTDAGKKEIQTVAERILPLGNSRNYHNALMDYGSLVLTARTTGISSLTKQNQFLGSIRELRGNLLKLISARTKISLSNIKKIFPDTTHDIEQVLNKMIEEKLISRNNMDYFV